MVHNLTDGHPGIARKHQVGSEDDDQDRPRLADETFQRVEAERSPPNAQLVPVVALLKFRLLPELDFLAVEGLHHVHALEDAHDAAAAPLVEPAHILAGALQPLALQ